MSNLVYHNIFFLISKICYVISNIKSIINYSFWLLSAKNNLKLIDLLVLKFFYILNILKPDFYLKLGVFSIVNSLKFFILFNKRFANTINNSKLRNYIILLIYCNGPT